MIICNLDENPFWLMNEMLRFPRPTTLAHEWIAAVLHSGDSAVDATLGNGHDALFLAQCVGVNGVLWGFDVQAQALQRSRERLLAHAALPARGGFFHQCHSEMASRVTEPVQAVMFNLGYLPGAERDCITETQKTLQALSAASELLTVGGRMTVVCYPGHAGGDQETAAVLSWADMLQDGWDVVRYQKWATRRPSPILLGMCKVAGELLEVEA